MEAIFMNKANDCQILRYLITQFLLYVYIYSFFTALQLALFVSEYYNVMNYDFECILYVRLYEYTYV